MPDPKDITVANLPDPKASLSAEYEHDAEPEPLPEAPKKTQEPPPSPRKHSPSLIRLAMKYGASREAIEQTSSSDLLEWIEEQEIVREQEREANTRRREVEQVVQRPAPKAEVPPNDGIDWGVDENGQPLKETDILPGLRNVIKAQHKKIVELEGGFKKVGEREQLRQRQAIVDAFDSSFDAIGDTERYGEGSGAEMPAQSAELQRRDAIIRASGIDYDKDTPAVIARKIKAAHKLMHGEAKKAEPAAEGYGSLPGKAGLQPNGKPRITEKQFQEGTLARATQRTDKAPKDRRQAAKAVGEKMRELQITDRDFDEFEEDGMPE